MRRSKWPGGVIAMVDILFTLMVCFMQPINPTTAADASDKPICHLAIDAVWPSNMPDDVDLWVRAPGDIPVGYSAKDGAVFNLVRDDLGMVYASDMENSERSCARFIPDGNYIANVHLYSNLSHEPVSVNLSVSFVDPSSARMTEILKKEVILEYPGQEITVIRWTMKDGKLVPGSENDVPIAIRHGSGQ